MKKPSITEQVKNHILPMGWIAQNKRPTIYKSPTQELYMYFLGNNIKIGLTVAKENVWNGSSNSMEVSFIPKPIAELRDNKRWEIKQDVLMIDGIIMVNLK